ncbi:zinc metalloproteinase nas-14-like [Montipora capricornis]|uniref:zinc metalloproteinase nas-14-like n=1 Tax=Montipora capricornis TaxID=246305 RepID=UPI0035F18FF6
MKLLAVLLMVEAIFSAPVDLNPEENRNLEGTDYFEGDMMLTPQQRGNAEMGLDVYISGGFGGQAASIITPLWPNGEIVYDIDSSVANDPRGMAAVMAGMDEWTSKTCIRFKKRTTETDYAYFTTGSGCSSFVGKIGGRQNIILERGLCWNKGTVTHEIGHAVGYFHEQSRPDRDQYVAIFLDNVKPGKKHNFKKYSRTLIDSLGTPYDYQSVMHYGQFDFTRNGLPTITPLKNGVTIGQRDGLSIIDANQANLLYKNCGRNAQSVTTAHPTTHST